MKRGWEQVLETRTDTPDMVAALSSLSEFYHENHPKARQHLRAAIDERSVEINELMLEEANRVLEDLDLVEDEIAKLVEACDKMCDTLTESKASTFDLLRETERLTVELDANRRRQELVGSFLGTYQLLPEEVTALQGNTISKEFFAALKHVQEIHANCKSLLRTHHQRAGLELMDVMAGYQEAAYEKLCRWVQDEFHAMSDDDTPEPHELLGHAALALQERPILFKYCAEEISNMCHNALFRRFINALTRGGPAGHPRPIEMHAHDPHRYVGDMLAWLHQALAAEKDIVCALFKDEKGGMRANLPVSYEVTLDKIFEGVCRPFKVRVEQVLSSNIHMLDIFKLINLLGSYVEMLQGSIGDDSLLARTIRDCKGLAEKSFFDQLNGSMARIQRNPPLPPRDLSPPQVVKDVLQEMSEVLQTSNTVRSQGEEPAGLDRLVDGFLAPLGDICERSASRLDSDNQSKLHRHSATYCVYLINCRSTMLSAVSGQPALRKAASALSQTLDNLSRELVDREVGNLLQECDAYELVQRIKIHHEQSSDADVLQDPALAPDMLVEALNRLFDHFASQQQSLPEFQSVQSPSLRSDLVRKMASEIEDAYKLLHGSLNALPSKAASVHTPAQFQTLLGGLV